jgi:hypothetical protein
MNWIEFMKKWLEEVKAESKKLSSVGFQMKEDVIFERDDLKHCLLYACDRIDR